MVEDASRHDPRLLCLMASALSYHAGAITHPLQPFWSFALHTYEALLPRGDAAYQLLNAPPTPPQRSYLSSRGQLALALEDVTGFILLRRRPLTIIERSRIVARVLRHRVVCLVSAYFPG